MTEAEKEMAEKIIMSMPIGSVVAFCNIHRHGWSEDELIENMEMPPDQVKKFIELGENHVDSQIRSPEFVRQFLGENDDTSETHLREVVAEYAATDYWKEETNTENRVKEPA